MLEVWIALENEERSPVPYNSHFLKLMLNPSAGPCELATCIFKALSTEADLPASEPSSKYQALCDKSAHSSSV